MIFKNGVDLGIPLVKSNLHHQSKWYSRSDIYRRRPRRWYEVNSFTHSMSAVISINSFPHDRVIISDSGRLFYMNYLRQIVVPYAMYSDFQQGKKRWPPHMAIEYANKRDVRPPLSSSSSFSESFNIFNLTTAKTYHSIAHNWTLKLINLYKVRLHVCLSMAFSSETSFFCALFASLKTAH